MSHNKNWLFVSNIKSIYYQYFLKQYPTKSCLHTIQFRFFFQTFIVHFLILPRLQSPVSNTAEIAVIVWANPGEYFQYAPSGWLQDSWQVRWISWLPVKSIFFFGGGGDGEIKFVQLVCSIKHGIYDYFLYHWIIIHQSPQKEANIYVCVQLTLKISGKSTKTTCMIFNIITSKVVYTHFVREILSCKKLGFIL